MNSRDFRFWLSGYLEKEKTLSGEETEFVKGILAQVSDKNTNTHTHDEDDLPDNVVYGNTRD